MDWSKFTDKLKPLKEKAAPFLEKAKDAWFKALDYTQKQLQNTPLVLKTIEEYTDLRTKKRVIVIAYNQNAPESREILMRSPLWWTQAWSDASELRFIETSEESELISHIAITTSLDMRVWYIGEETFHATDLASILKWWETRCYDGKQEEEKTKEAEVNADPLAWK